MRKPTFLLLLFFASTAFAQNEANNWYFGNYASVQFSGNSVSTLNVGALLSEEACASISDTNGNILFYTNGAKVWNKNLFVTPNGNNLTGTSTTSQILIIPNLLNHNLYYIFYADGFGGPNGLRYSEFDATLDNGLGDILPSTKNTLLYTNASEKLAAIQHCNGESVWLLSMDYSTNEFVAHLITKSGIQAPARTQSGQINGWCCNSLKFSPQGGLLAYTETLPAGGSSDAMLYRFNTGNGSTALLTHLPVDSVEGEIQYGISFSPNSKKLYISSLLYRSSSGNKSVIYQYDLNSNDIALSKKTIYSRLSNLSGNQVLFGSIQNAPNGKIYIAKLSPIGKSSDTLAAINNPDSLGAKCNFEYNALYLSGRSSMLGLPNYIESYFNPKNNLPDLCSSVDIKENQPIAQFKVFPNPSSGMVHIDFFSQQNSINIKLYDASRSTVISRKFKNSKQVQLYYSELSSGLYFLEITTPQFQKTVKLIFEL